MAAPVTTGEAVFRAEGISKIYRLGEVEVAALRGVDLELLRGEFAVLLGPSGSGKSTLLNILGGLDVPTAGRVHFLDHDLSVSDDAALTRFRRDHVGFVFQFYNIAAGDTALVQGWGDTVQLRARVRLVEPSGFTKVSALGVEEQRVNVIADFLDPPGRLGDRYRVEMRVIVARGDSVLVVPVGALFQERGEWRVFAVRGGRAEKRTVTLGLRGTTEAEVKDGLSDGDMVVRYPGDRVKNGVRVRVR